MDRGGTARIFGPTYRLFDNLEDPPLFVCVGSTETTPDVIAAVVYCTAVTAELNEGSSDLPIEVLAGLLVDFYGFSPGAVTPWGHDIDVWEERRKHFRRGEPLPSYTALRTDPALHRDGLVEAIAAQLRECVAA